MRINIVVLSFLVLPMVLNAQVQKVPQVPNKMKFADIQLKITEGARREIQSDVDALTASSKFFQAKVDRAAMYLPFVEKAFKEEGLPDDFKYLAIQESGFISDAVSTSNAVGFWQFKDLTAKEVGLRVDKKVDERQNIVASSHAAAKYLQKNNFYFNNWIYALQAYQMGAGGAMDALGEVKGGGKNLTIDKKTYWYVKKYLAHKIAFQDAIVEAKTSQPKLQVYEQGGGQSLAEIAKEAKVEVSELEEFNKWLLTKRIPDDRPYQVIIPSTEASLVMAGANPLKAGRQPVTSSTALPPARDIVLGEDTYRNIKLNDLPGVITNQEMTIDELAELLNFDPNKLIAYNDLLPHYRIISGQVYYLKAKRGKARIFYHTVQEGENVWIIAQNYGMKQKNLMKMNRIIDKEANLEIGRILWLKKTRPEKVAVEYWPGSNTGNN
jgi:membrane-bound lytic murein transglycosylase D